MRRKICGVLAFASFIWVIGLAGSVDIGRITFEEFVAQGTCAMAVFVLSTWIGGFLG